MFEPPIIQSSSPDPKPTFPSRPPEVHSSGLEEHAANGKSREDDIDLPREDDDGEDRTSL